MPVVVSVLSRYLLESLLAWTSITVIPERRSRIRDLPNLFRALYELF